ncbi:MAG: glycosyltransferase family 2 protein [Candidatus Accumulibacter meliphilus]|jgi:GT2 family glycosyltransferase|uniref:glycosyltransferase family 2 protein n=1 Tax=Candidatus Accumulibacter meliphilus TaxID=2211374 RepID=UPI002FC36525
MWRKFMPGHSPSPKPLRRVTLKAQGLADIGHVDGTGTWLVTGPEPRLELLPESGHYLSGWVLLRGELHRRGMDFTTALLAEVAGPFTTWVEYHIPVSLKGTILELLYFQPGVVRLEFQPMGGAGSFELLNLSLQKVNAAGVALRRAQRVRHIFLTKPRSQREKMGLHWHTPLLGLRKSYELAGRLRGYYPTLNYAQWLERVDALTGDDRRRMLRHSKQWRKRPAFGLLVFAGVAEIDQLKLTLSSLQSQLYLHVRVLVLAPENELTDMREALSIGPEWLSVHSLQSLQRADESSVSGLGEHDWWMTLPAGAVLGEHALYWYASTALSSPQSRLLYSDHDHLDADGCRVDPEFKPDWSLELLRSSNYLQSAVALRADLVAEVSSVALDSVAMALANGMAGEGLHAYLLRATERMPSAAIQHITAVLLHLPKPAGDESVGDEALLIKPVAEHLSRLGVDAETTLSKHRYCRVRYKLPALGPLVTIIIPTRDELHHLHACVESVLSRSTYRNFELLVVDNQSSDAETLQYLRALEGRSQVRVLRYPQVFNFSAINNFATANAGGEVLCLLNNDTEVITPDWLEEMLGHLIQADVGVVGAKLYFGDGRVQHAGDTVGPGGLAHHLHSFLAHDAPGYCGRAVQAQDLSAVTGACLLTWKKLYQDLGGLDAVNLPVAFNDVDYCLRVRDAKRRVVWTPYAELYHHESVSRGKEDSPEKIRRARREVQYMRKRWQGILHHDPFYNPNLSYERPDFSLSHSPAVSKPWLP